MTFKKPSLALVAKYLALSMTVYVAILISMYIFADILKVNPRVSFFLVYGMAYVSEYLLNLKVLFVKTHSWAKVVKYLLHVGFFFTSGNMLFAVLVNLHAGYMLATLLAAGALFPLRFLAHKYFVYR